MIPDTCVRAAMKGNGRRPSAAASKPGPGYPPPDYSHMTAALAEATAQASIPAAPAPAEQLDFGALMAALGQESATAGGAGRSPNSEETCLLADMMAALGGPGDGPDASSELQALLAGLTGQIVGQDAGQEGAHAAPEPKATSGGGPQRLDYSAMLAGLAELTPGSERVSSGADRLEEPAPAEGTGEGLDAFPPVIQQCVTRPAIPLGSPLDRIHDTYVQSP